MRALAAALALSSLALFLWLQAEPGVLRAVLYDVMLIAGVSTVMFNGNPLMTAVGCAVLDAVLTPGVLETVAARGTHARDRLSELSRRYGLNGARGRGLLLALDLGQDVASAVTELAREAGLLVDAPRAHLLRFMPALNVSEDEVNAMVAILESVVQHVLAIGGTRSRAAAPDP